MHSSMHLPELWELNIALSLYNFINLLLVSVHIVVQNSRLQRGVSCKCWLDSLTQKHFGRYCEYAQPEQV